MSEIKYGDNLTIEQVKAYNTLKGYYFFSPSTMRFFNSKVYSEVCAGESGWYFVTSERYETEPRRYTVRVMRIDGSTDEPEGHSDGFGKYASKRQAVKAMLAIANKDAAKYAEVAA